MSVVDRGEPEASCSEWHGDGTAGEHDRASHLMVEAQARPMGEAGPGRRESRWQEPGGLAAAYEGRRLLLKRCPVRATRQQRFGPHHHSKRPHPAALTTWQDVPMVADSALLIEQLAANAWPAATVQLVDGWLLRYTPGVARRRSNSALPSPGATCASPAQRAQVLDLTERFYARRRQPTAVQVSPAELHDQLDGKLAARGYRRQAPTLVLIAPIHRVPVRAPTTSAVAVSIADAVTAQWLAAWTAIEARPDAAATNQQILAGSVRKPATSPRSTTATWSAWGWWWSSGVGPGCSAWPPDPPTAVAGWPTPCSSTRPVGLPIKESTSSTFRSRRTTSPPCGSTAGSDSSRPTAITTAWRRPDRPRFRRRITKRRERSRPGSRPRWSSPRL